MFNTRNKYMRRNSMVRDLLDANTASNSRTALESLATTLNPPVAEQPTQPTQVGMFGQASPVVTNTSPAFSEGWDTGFITDVPRHASSSRYGEWGAPIQKEIQLEKSVEGLAENYKIGNGLSFGATRDVSNLDPSGKNKVKELNNFIQSEDYLKGFEDFQADIASQGLDSASLSIQDKQKIYADAQGIGAHNNAVQWSDKLNEFKFIEDKFDVGDVAEIGAKALITFAAGGALAPMFAAAGLGTTAAASAGKAMAGALSSAVQGGDLKDVATSAIFAGATEYASSISEVATTAMDSALAEGVNVTTETLASAASLADKAKIATNVSNALKVVKAVDDKDLVGGVVGLTSLAGVATDTSTNTLKLVKAVKEKNILDSVTSALELGGLESPTTYAKEVIEKNFGDVEWVTQNSDALAEASIKFVDKVTQGKSVEEALGSSALKYAKEGGGLSQLIPDGLDTGDFELDSEFIDTILEAGKNIDKEYIQPAKNTIVELANQTGKFIKDNLPDVPDVDLTKLKQTLSTINKKDIQPVVKDVKEFLSEVNKEDIQPVVDDVKESLSDFNKEEIKPVVDDVKEFFENINLPDLPDLPDIDFPSLSFPSLSGGLTGGGGGRGTAPSKADLVNIALTNPELVEGMEYDDLSNYLTQERTI